MRGGPMRIDGGVRPRLRAARVTGYTLAPMKDLHGQGRVAHVQLLMHQGVGSAVIVALDLDVVIDVDARFLPFGERVAVGWQAAQRRPVERLEPGAAAALELAKSAGIEPVQQFRDRGVQIGQVEERAFAQDGQDPPFHQKHTRLGLRLVPGFAHARRNDSDAGNEPPSPDRSDSGPVRTGRDG